MIRQYELIDKILAYNPQADVGLLNRAYVYSMKAHGNQKRASGESYLTHPLAVAEILADMKMDEVSIAVGLLHDTLEDTLSTYDELKKLFGDDVAKLTDGVTKLSRVKFNTKAAEQAENFRKLLLAMADDIRVLIVKLADRLHNMRTLHYIEKPEKRIAKARETMEIFAPLADRIGLYSVKTELEDLSFQAMNQEEYVRLQAQLTEMLSDNTVVDDTLEMLRDDLKKQGIDANVSGRTKTIYSIHRKMLRKNLTFDQLTDIVAYRILVESKSDCYEVLGHMHDQFKAVPGRFKDYISSPKVNGYQSLHTAVIGPFGDRMEIQIRTNEMHEIAEHGIAAHFFYKTSGSVKGKKSDKREGAQYKWLKELVEQLQVTTDAEEFFNQAKLDLFSDSVFVFTPTGDLLHLPAGATPLDFAYSIHSEVGNKTQTAKVNGRVVPLKYRLHNGDQVEIITAKTQVPSPAWREIVVTGKARAAINRYLSEIERDSLEREGKEILEKATQRESLKIKEKELPKLFKQLNYDNTSDAYVALAQGRLFPRQIFALIRPEEPKKDVLPELPEEDTTEQKRPAAPGSLAIDGLGEGIAVQLAKCCSPLPGESIVGVVTTGRAVMIHNSECQNLKQYEGQPERLLHLSWRSTGLDAASQQFSVRLTAELHTEPGALASFTNAIFNAGGNITDLNIVARNQDFSTIKSEIEVNDRGHYERLLAALRGLNCVRDVGRSVG